MLHEEPIWRDGRLVGTTTSGGFAFTLGRPIGMGYVHNPDGPAGRDWVLSGAYEIEVAGERHRATPTLAAPFDPKGARMRG
jgi:4-methylaminobutanoate oxidase (formaldehyde-forming)